jgi:dihydrofolate synthase/folylpolyglutamate synthase
MGFVADKDIDHIIELFPMNAIYYITNAQIPRALPIDELAVKCQAIGLQFTQYSTVIEAYRKALSEAQDDDIIYVGGSTFIVADLLADLQK